MILNIGGGGGVKPRIVVTAPTGSDVTVSKGTTILYAPEVSGTWTFNVPEQGDWSATAILGSKTASKVVSVGKVGVYNVTLRYVSATLNDNSWEDIKGVADASEGQNYWAVGDTKQITINGKLSDGLTLSNYSTYVYIIGFDHNASVEGTGIAFQGFKTAQTGGIDVALCDSGYNSTKTSGQWFNMNNANSTAGGWASSRMRTTTLPVVKAALPSDLTGALKTTTVYSNNTGGGSDVASYVTSTTDDLYLLAEFEIFGTRIRANSAEQNYQQQYTYYAAGNSKVKYRHSNTSANAFWWERSAYATGTDIFCRVSETGTSDTASASFSYGLAPAFKVGTTPIFPTLNDNSWSAIAKVAYTSEGANYWSVGDTKEITINGKLSDGLTLSNYKTWVCIIGFDHNKDIEGVGIVFQGLKSAQTGGKDAAFADSRYNSYKSSGQWFNMNNSQSNAGGWASSLMRTVTLPVVKAALPSDLTSVIKQSTIYTDNTGGGIDAASYVTATQDDLYLLAEWEIFGAQTYANSAEQNYQQQYDYYIAGHGKIRYKDRNTDSTVSFGARSVDRTRTSSFCQTSGGGAATYVVAGNSNGLAPAFRVCYTPPRPISNFAVGDIVKIKESGADVDYIIVHQGNPDTTLYDASCDGAWLLRKDCVTQKDWNAGGTTTYDTSAVNTYLNSTFYNLINASQRSIIKQVKIPYVTNTPDSGNPIIATGSSGFETYTFLLSAVETGGNSDGMPNDGIKLNWFVSGSSGDAGRVVSSGEWWTRSVYTYNARDPWKIDRSGAFNRGSAVDASMGVRPAFIIPSNTLVDSSGNIMLE